MDIVTPGAAAPGYWILPAADEPLPNGDPNVEFKLGVPDTPTASTGRWSLLRSAFSWHVYPPDRTAGSCGKRATVSEQAARNGCVAATNLSPFSYAADAQCEPPLVSDGKVLLREHSGSSAGCMGLFKRHANSTARWIFGEANAIARDGVLDELEQLVCGFQPLVINGTALSSSQTLIAPRTAMGIDAAGRLITMVAEGSEVVRTGLTLNMTAAFMLKIGAVFAVNYDGGGSSAFYWKPNGGTQGCPTGKDVPTCVERSVATTSCIKA
jgi:exopolysaccharide biosynthesis protein